jgi:Uma2 family endonuclease
MEEYIENGVQLGWLIEPTQRTVYIYRPHLPVETQENLNALSADPTLSGFELDLTEIW